MSERQISYWKLSVVNITIFQSFSISWSEQKEMQPIKNIPWAQTETSTSCILSLGYSDQTEARHESAAQHISSISAAELGQIIRYWSQEFHWR